MKCRNPIVIHYVCDMDRAKDLYTAAIDEEPAFELRQQPLATR